MKKTAYKLGRSAFFLLGLFVLYGVVRKIGWHNLQTQVTQLHWELVPVFCIGFLWYLCYTLAWNVLLKHQGISVPFWRLFQSKISGETFNAMTPANFVGGDTMRVYLLRRRSNVTSLAASVVVDRTINSIAIVAVIFFGAVAAFLTLPGLPPQMAIGVPIFLVGNAALIAFFLVRQHKGLFASLLRLAKKWHFFPKTAEKYLHKATELDQKVVAVYENSHTVFWQALALHLVGRLLGVVEVYCIGKAIAPQFTLLIALFLATLAPIINMAFTFIPGALGVLEGAYSGALYLLGLNPALGLTIQIVKRMRATLWMGLGFVFILTHRHRRKAVCNADPLRQPL